MSWPQVRISEVTEIVSGATPKTALSSYWDGDIAWATPADLSDLDGAYIGDTPRKITEAGLRSCAASILPPNSVLFSSRAPIGHVAINTVPMATNQGFKSFVPNNRVLNSKFLFWWLKAHRARLEAMGTGATFKEVSKATVSRVEIPLPPLEEQKRIAAILDKSDQLRQKRGQAIALLDSLSESIFLEMFGEPVSNPRGFAVKELQEIVDPHRKITYGILMPGPDVPDGVPYVRVMDMRDGLVLVDQLRRTTSEIAKEYRRSSLRAGDLLISIRGHVGRLAVTPRECDGANITQDTARLAISEANPLYVSALLSTSEAQHWMAQRTKGVAVRGINLGDLKKFPVMLPAMAEQNEFARQVEQKLKVIQLKEAQLRGSESLFSSLQHRAFTGQL
ncbi:restriction endonuclease subunit S [Rhizobium leguminosarum]|uniref:restriction endonuclease subunit S n=1 Tax=Rhizobium leguminosarum TaxID=384 RepID=UPI003F9C9300